jgi:3-oxoacid CoA-transferase subunit A
MDRSNKICSAADAIGLIKNGSKIMVGGFGNAGNPEEMIDLLVKNDLKELTIISNDLGSPGIGLGKLLENNNIKALIGNYYNWNPEVALAYNEKIIDVTLIPQGTFAEAIRAAGVGIPGFYTPTSQGTDLGKGKETKEFDGKLCVLEMAIHADIALIRAHKADELGNLIYYKTARNFNPLMAMAAKLTIVEVDEIVPVGDLDPEMIVTPHLFVNKIVQKVKR